MNRMMRVAILLSGTLCIFTGTDAVAAHWLMAPNSVYEMYDADSVRAEATTGLIYLTACTSIPYKLTCSNEPTAYAFSCKQLKSAAYYSGKWHDWIAERPGSEEGYLFYKLCTESGLALK